MINKFKKQQLIWLIGFLLLGTNQAKAQQNSSLTLDDCFEMAKENYPAIKEYTLIEKSTEFSLSNAQKGYLPRLNVSGQATYQSDVTSLPISMPNLDIPAIDKSQYRLYGEVTQSITDLFTIKDQKEYISTHAEIETQKTEVELYQLRERIDQLFFGILLIEAQIKQAELRKKDIQNGIEKTNVAIANGIALKSTADNLKAELLNANQRTIELEATRKGYAEMLSLFIGRPIDENTRLEKPHPQTFPVTINRPELRLFDLQKKSFDVQNKLITTKNLPRFDVFVQGGLGRPALNMLSPDLEGYYIAGLRMTWNISGFYTSKNEKSINALQQNSIDIRRETFLFNTNLQLKQQHADITKVQELMQADREIIILRESVKKTAQNQLAFGTATTNDYLLVVNAEDLARQNLILHEIQLLMTQYAAQTTTGNQGH